MQGIAKRGLALFAATSGLALGPAGIAAADAAPADGSHSDGTTAGWTAQAPVNVPVTLGGDGPVAAAPAAAGGAHGQVRAAEGSPMPFRGWKTDGAAVAGPREDAACAAGPAVIARRSAGVMSGGIVRADVNDPITFCGVAPSLSTSSKSPGSPNAASTASRASSLRPVSSSARRRT